jgi:hypothetical protein
MWLPVRVCVRTCQKGLVVWMFFQNTVAMQRLIEVNKVAHWGFQYKMPGRGIQESTGTHLAMRACFNHVI